MTQIRPHSTLAAMGPNVAVAIGAHLETAFRSMAIGPCVWNDPKFWRLLTREPHPLGNLALLSAAADVAAARAAIEPLVSAAIPAAVLFPGIHVPADIDAYLANRGFGPHGALPAMAIDISELPDSRLPPGYEFAQVGDADRDEWVRQFAIGYELPLGVAQCFAPHGSAGQGAAMQFFAVRKDGAIVGTSVSFLADGVAGIYCVSTISAQRGKGLGAYATAEPLRIAARRGYGVGVLQSSEAGHSIYKRLGFKDFGGVPLYVRMP